MSDSWVVQNLNNALNTWNEKLAEVWELLLMSPQSFKSVVTYGLELIRSNPYPA